MKLSNTTIRELNAQYRSVLKKCFILNAAVLIAAFATTPAMAADTITAQELINPQETKIFANVTASGLTTNSDGAAIYNNEGTVTVSSSSFDGNTSGNFGGAIRNRGILTVEGGSFKNNVADAVGGAIATATREGTNLIVKADANGKSAVFENNHSKGDGGAIGSYQGLEISAAQFIGNTAQLDDDGNGNWTKAVPADETAIGGGAISLGSVSKSQIASISSTLFKNNKSGTNGGAIGTRMAKNGDNVNAKLKVNATFIGNEAINNGGAIYNTFYADAGEGNGEGVLVSGTFEANIAGKNGGAIYNDSTISGSNTKGAVMTVTDSMFSDNNAGGNGGAIVNERAGTLNLSGTTSFQKNEANGNGGAIWNWGTVNIENATFEGNTAASGGAFWNHGNNTATGILDITGKTTFKDNTATTGSGGAIYVYGYVKRLNNAYFENNKAGTQGGAINLGTTVDAMNVGVVDEIVGSKFKINHSKNGGAIATQGTIKKIDNVTFEGNTATSQGGAIYAKAAAVITNMSNTDFIGNTSEKNGGAIATAGHFSSIKNVKFEGNKAAAEGGAISMLTPQPNSDRHIVFDGDVSFIGNEAGTTGGAINMLRTSHITFNGNNTFKGNTANGLANDIHNAGQVTIASGTTTMDGGITGNGSLTVASGATLDITTAKVEQGAVTIENGATLAAKLVDKNYALKADTITASGANLNLTVTGVGEYEVITGTGADDFNVSSSGFYTVTKDTDTADGKLIVTATAKSADKIAKETGVSQQTGQVIAAIAGSDNTTANQITLNMQELAKSPNGAAAVQQAAEALAPTTSATVQSVSTSVNGQIMTVVGGRVNSAQGRSGGDVTASVGPWIKGLYNKSRQEASTGVAGFHGYTQGVAMGIDTKINDTYTLGIGYAYSATDVKSLDRKTNVYGHNFFVYGEYQPNAWFINGAVNYGMSDYKENKVSTGVLVNGKYDVDTIGGQIMSGYDTAFGLTPEVGVKYLHIKQDSYTDTAGQRIETDDSDLLTAVIGGRYGYDIATENVTFTPELRLAATYDIVSDNANATVALGASSYTSDGKRLPRFGIEAGVGMKWNIAQRMDINLDYDASIRRRYTSHTGTISLKYNF